MSNFDDLVDAKKVVTGVVSRALDAILKPLEGTIRKRVADARNGSERLLESYLLRKLDQARSIKSIVHVGAAENIEKLYVPCRFVRASGEITETTFFDLLQKQKRMIVIGTAGAGKSFFMRHSFVSHLNSGALGIPLYVELRSLNERPEQIFDYVLRDIGLSDENFMKEQLDLGLRHGFFSLILDGLDELNPNRFRSVQADICELSERYPECRILVTSRPVDGPEAWRKFSVYRMSRLSYTAAQELVRKSGIHSRTQEAFLSVFTEKFFESHRSFLEIPLLLTIMALTFRDNREISSSIATFYEDAYSALISRHDATKDFKRLFFSELDRASFRAVLNQLSAATYSNYKYTMNETEILEYIQKSANAVKDRFSAELYLDDLLTSVCMIIREGFELKYAHRSFQEYFCAAFVCGLDGQNAGKSLERISRRPDAVQVLRFVREINRDVYEVCWLLPSLEKLCSELASASNTVAGVRSIFDIVIGGRPTKIEATPTATVGQIVSVLGGLAELSPSDLVEEIRLSICRAYEVLDTEALQRNAMGVDNPRHYPDLNELLAGLGVDPELGLRLQILRNAVRTRLESLIEQRRNRDTTIDTLFQ